MEKKLKEFEMWLDAEINYCRRNVKQAAKNNDYMLPRFKHDLVEAIYIKDRFDEIFKNNE